MRRFHIPAVFVAMVLGLATLGWWLSGMPFWIAVVMSAGAVWVNGLILTVEDDLPGGFNNPDGQSTPPYVGKLQMGIRIASALVVTLASGMLALGAARLGELTPRKPVFWAIAALLFAAAAIVRRKTRSLLLSLAAASLIACVVLSAL